MQCSNLFEALRRNAAMVQISWIDLAALPELQSAHW
jgi:hypothetical protein